VSTSKPFRNANGDVAASAQLSPRDLARFHRECRDRGYQLKLSPREPREEFPGVLRYDLMINGRDVWHGYLVPPFDRALERAMLELESLQAPSENGRRSELSPAAEPGGWRRLRNPRKR
jgi:hypothetical protein